MTPARGLVLVRLADTEETLPGGRILLTQNVREELAAYQCEVLAVGEPDFCENKKCDRDHEYEGVPCDCPLDYIGPCPTPSLKYHIISDLLVVGAWCVVKHRSFVPSDDPHGKTFYVRQDDVLAVLSGAPGGS